MKLFKSCPVCNSENLIGDSIDLLRKGPHISRTKCLDCELIFANPMAESKELEEYYKNYTNSDKYEGFDIENLHLKLFNKISNYDKIMIFKKAKYMSYCDQIGNFLDVGCGLGLGLSYAENLGYKLYATELDKNAIKFVRNNFNVDIFEGLLDEANYESNFFDFIHVSHVIEHVSDLNLFLNELRRILKPNGFLSIGTPDISSKLYRIHRVVRHLQLKVPDIIDGVEHTFLFSKNTLRKVCEDHEFEIIDQFSEKIGESFFQIFKYNMSYSKKLKRLIQSFFNINQWIILKK